VTAELTRGLGYKWILLLNSTLHTQIIIIILLALLTGAAIAAQADGLHAHA
jgi:hypothetical protein